MQRPMPLLLLALVLALPACTTPPRVSSSESQASSVAPEARVRAFTGEGAPAAWDDMVASLSQADVVVIGESHAQPEGLAAAAALWRDIARAKPDAALAMEFFERDHQLALDDYLADITDEDAFRAAASRAEGNYPESHRDMVETAKRMGRPVVAANAPRRYVRMTTPTGFERLESLGDVQRDMFVIPERLVEGRYRDEFFRLMGGGGHGSQMPPETIEKFYFSQQLWDATMASSVVDALNAGNRPVVLVVGRFHTDFDGATIEFMHRARPDLDIRAISVLESSAPGLRSEDVGRADFVWYAPPGNDADRR